VGETFSFSVQGARRLIGARRTHPNTRGHPLVALASATVRSIQAKCGKQTLTLLSRGLNVNAAAPSKDYRSSIFNVPSFWVPHNAVADGLLICDTFLLHTLGSDRFLTLSTLTMPPVLAKACPAVPFAFTPRGGVLTPSMTFQCCCGRCAPGRDDQESRRRRLRADSFDDPR
jgi:hypothetical protein